MTLLNFDDDVQTATVVKTRPVVTETVEVAPVLSEARAFLAKPDESWAWDDLRDYVVTQIEAKFGPWPRNSQKEYGIFTRFLNTWGPLAPRIARYAFENCDGWWQSAPVSINRFTKGSDPYFAVVIAERLTQ